jgi:hypothetical protein
VHFSGHGSAAGTQAAAGRHLHASPAAEQATAGGGLVLEDAAGRSRVVPPEALSAVFALHRDTLRCVVLNACYSEAQACAIAAHIDCVVGMSRAIGDPAAIRFATAFYQALAYGRDLQFAFASGRAEIALENLPEAETPQLLATRVDPAQVVLVTPQSAGPGSMGRSGISGATLPLKEADSNIWRGVIARLFVSTEYVGCNADNSEATTLVKQHAMLM